MDTIISYLDNIFASLPRTEAVLKARRELQAIMEEKYHALKNEGKSENEAVGAVISEFGNIDEIVGELGIRRSDANPQLPLLKEEQVRGYLAASRQSGSLIGLGVLLCLAGVASLVLISGLTENGLFGIGLPRSGSVVGLIIMFLCIAVGVGLFIFSGMQMDRYKYLEKGFALPERLQQDIQREHERNTTAFTTAIVIGVGLCILSPVPLFLTAVFPALAGSTAVGLLLLTVGVAVFLFIKSGMNHDAYQRLLQIEEYAPEKAEANKTTGAVASVVFPLAALVFLYLGFFHGMWHPGWMIFPAVGILFGIFSSIYEATHSRR